jgi:hypothetical protein
MIGAIGTSSFISPAGSGPSIAALQAQLDSYQKQLSDCVNCATATTPQGKQNIQDISSRISDVQARIQQAAAKSNTQSTVNITASSATLTLGNYLDVMA